MASDESSSAPLMSGCGFRMLSKMGWKEGEGLGKGGSGMKTPLALRAVEGTSGLGKREADDDALRNAAAKARRVVEPNRDDLDERLKQQNAEFYCAVCSKQYKTVSEFSNHLSSYDHHHRKRFKEMSQTLRPKKKSNEDDTFLKQRIERARAKDATPAKADNKDIIEECAKTDDDAATDDKAPSQREELPVPPTSGGAASSSVKFGFFQKGAKKKKR